MEKLKLKIKTLHVEEKTWAKIMKLKLEERFSTIDETINYLLINKEKNGGK